GSLPRGAGFGADQCVLTVRFVPDGNHFHAFSQGLYAGLQLRLGLMCKPVASPYRIFAESQTFPSPRPEISQPTATGPQAQARVRNEKYFLALDSVVAVPELLWRIPHEHVSQITV